MNNAGIPNKYFFLDTIAAAHADIVSDGGLLKLKKAEGLVALTEFRKIKKVVIQPSVAETLGAYTLIYAQADNYEYTARITQFDRAANREIPAIISFQGLATGETAITAGQKGKAIVDANRQLQVTTSGAGATITVTGKAGFPVLKTIGDGNKITTGVTTPGVYSRNKAADLIRLGYPASAYTGAGYTLVQIHYNDRQQGAIDTETGQNLIFDWFVNEAATNFAALNTYLGEIFAGLIAGTTDADPEQIAFR